ncbi:hypothetical protein ACIPW9_36310 [Streptomyces sp. NPDC090052]|uniref:hypothetical protein n=1 Tax=Streptomyces sp. NPDC090052 TaxID=3365931 RepID=UPI0038075DDE
MAADILQRDFTQIHNRLFRDQRLSFKAKGIFGLISTHRNGYGVTPEWIAAAGTDGPAAVRSGLRELERHGYLVRRQDRKQDGTMGQMTYSITDMPRSGPDAENRTPAVTCDDTQTHRSEPDSDYPHAGEPQAADRTHKKTNLKKTSEENTVRPSFPAAEPGEVDGGTDGSSNPERNPGLDLLLAIGAQQPEFLLTGKTLRDQALTVTGMLFSGWTEHQLRQVIAGRPLPSQVKTSVGAIVARRLRDAISGPPPSSVPSLPGQFQGSEAAADKPTPTPANWSVKRAHAEQHQSEGECEGRDGMCGRPTVAGTARCQDCQDATVTV